MEAILSFKSFSFFIHRLGNIKVLSKLDPGRVIHWEIGGVCTFAPISMTVSQWFPSTGMVTICLYGAIPSHPLNDDICCLL